MHRLSAPSLPQWLEKQVPFERYVVDIEGHGVHVMEAGKGRPVLMVHGNPTWGYLWRKVVAALSGPGGPRLRLVMPDLVGLGFSSRLDNPSDHTLANHRRWMTGLCRTLGLEEMIVVGQDWGGPISLGAAASVPEETAGLVILNTVVAPPKPGFKPTAFHRFSRMPVISDLAFLGLSFPQSMLWTAQGDRASISGEVARAYRYPLRSIPLRRAPLALARMVPDTMAHPSVPELERVRAFVEGFGGPAAIVWGERDPILGRLRRRAERLLPQAEVTVTQAGHFLQEEVPASIAAAIQGVAAQLGG